MDSMADLMRKLGWIAWCIAVIGWFASPIISLLVNKLFSYISSDASTKLKELEYDTIPRLKRTLDDVEEQMVLRAAEDKGSQSNLKILDSMHKDLKSALYEAEDILDILDYRRIEKGIYLGNYGGGHWVEHKLDAACAWITRYKGSWFGRWIDVTLTAVMKNAQSVSRQGLLLIQGWGHWRPNFDLFCSGRAVNIVLQCVQSWYQHLHQRWPGALLPVARPAPQSPCPEFGGSVFVPADSTHRPAEEMINGEEIMEGTQVVEEEAKIEEELEIKNAEEGVIPEEIVQEGCGEVGDTSEYEIEDDKKGKDGEPTSLSMLRYCARYMLTWYVKASFCRDWSYGIVGIKSDKEDGSAAELVPITERISLMIRIKRIEDILTASKKSDLLNDKNNSSSRTNKDADHESIKNSAQSSNERKEIDDMHKSIEHKVFGREEDRLHISRMLREGPDTNAPSSSTVSPYSVIGIYGITGSGKTTLAQYVCDYEKGAGHFNPIMFILVGKTFSIGDIFRDILEQITQRRPTNDKDLKSLKKELEENLKDKCFLLVLDDIWVNDENQKERDILLDLLSTGLRGSGVLVTSQKKDAARALGAQEQISIPDLEERFYLSLFMHHARPDDGEYERIGRKIAYKLHRSPIAAVTVGKQLQRNKSISFWETTANLDVLNKTMGALWWSYQQLDADIRRCFAYCSTFPQGYRLERDELVCIWIAQGFVNATHEELEDVGQRYCQELLKFSFLQGRKKNSLRKTETFTIHDLLHELAERVSRSDFFRIGLNESPKDIPRGVHHLFIETTNGVEIAKKLVEQENLRTLIIKEPSSTALKFTYGGNHDTERLLERLFMRLTKLRVLIIKQDGFGEELSVPACIDRMKHLRYLGLRFCTALSVLILPSTFSKLYHIEIIDIPFDRASRCPEDMANLIYLRHIPACLYFPNIGRLSLLRTMRSFKVKEEQGYELKQLKLLNKLGGTLIIDSLGIVESKVEVLEAHLTHKERLRELKLDFGSDKRFGPDVEAEVLEGLCPPKDLQQLHIWFYRGSRYPSWMLSGHHPDAPKQLRRLELYHCSSQLVSIPEDNKLFIGLRELKFTFCDMDWLPQNMVRLVSLQTLTIFCCDKVEHLPTLPHQSLEVIHIISCNVLSKTCKEEGHENWQKIQHIAKKWIL